MPSVAKSPTGRLAEVWAQMAISIFDIVTIRKRSSVATYITEFFAVVFYVLCIVYLPPYGSHGWQRGFFTVGKFQISPSKCDRDAAIGRGCASEPPPGQLIHHYMRFKRDWLRRCRISPAICTRRLYMYVSDAPPHHPPNPNASPPPTHPPALSQPGARICHP